MQLKRKIAGIIVISLLVNTSYAFATDTNSLQQEMDSNNEAIKDLEEKRNDINDDIEKRQQEVSNIQAKIDAQQAKINEVNNIIFEYQEQIDELQHEIDNVTAEIEESQIEIEMRQANAKKLEEEEIKTEELLDARVRSVYKLNLANQYIYMIITSKSISEVFQNLNTIRKILQYDKDLIANLKETQKEIKNEIAAIDEKIKEQEINKELIEVKQKELVSSQNEVLVKKAEEQGYYDELAAMEAEKQEMIIALENDGIEIDEEIDSLLAYNQELQAQIDSIINNINNGSENQDKVEQLPSESGFLRPVGGEITTYFGPRINPVTGLPGNHNGMDYAGSFGESILATKSGVVEYVGWIEGYGNTVILNHGNGVQSLYGHAQGFNVTYGQTVSQGDVIAFVGSTGQSTGPHLHFEIIVNGQRVDPYDYIPY